MKMPDGRTKGRTAEETHCQGGAETQEGAEGGTGDKAEWQGKPTSVRLPVWRRPNLITQSIRQRIEFHDPKSAMGQIKNAERPDFSRFGPAEPDFSKSGWVNIVSAVAEVSGF